MSEVGGLKEKSLTRSKSMLYYSQWNVVLTTHDLASHVKYSAMLEHCSDQLFYS